jgi:hypothetical protein
MTPTQSRPDGTELGWGPASLLANGVLLYVVLACLAKSAVDAFDRTFLLAAGNLGVACVLFVPRLRVGPLLPRKTAAGALLGWSFAYVITYGSFVCFPELIPVWGLVAACAKASNAYAPVGQILKLDPASFTEDFLHECYDRVSKHYEKLAEKHAVSGDKDYDALAKGQGQYLLKKLSAELK